VAAGVAMSMLAACGGNGGGGGGSADEETTLTFLHKWPEPQYKPFFDQVVADYEKSNPNVKIDAQAVGDQPIKDKLRVLASSNQMPDVYFSWAGDFTKKFIDGGFAADITDAVQGSDWKNRLAPAGVQAFTYDGKVYGVPMDLDGKFLVYNTAIFEDNGIAEPKTLDDLLTACDTLKSAGVQPIAFGNQFGWAAIHYLTTLNARYVPQDVLKKDYDPQTATWEDPGYVQALETFQELQQRCLSENANGVAHDDAVAQLLNGKAGMVYVQSVEFSKFTKAEGAPDTIVNNWDFFDFPAIPGAEGDQESLTGAPDGFLVNEKSENKDVALDFLQFFTSEENGKKLTEEMGRLSAVKGSATAENATPQLRDALAEIEQATTFNIWLDTVTHTKVASAYLAGAEGLLGGNVSPQDVMASVKKASDEAKQAG
jgi:raffinose/stachyose/melibiose transport system substrate-binding protein